MSPREPDRKSRPSSTSSGDQSAHILTMNRQPPGPLKMGQIRSSVREWLEDEGCGCSPGGRTAAVWNSRGTSAITNASFLPYIRSLQVTENMTQLYCRAVSG